MGTDRRPGNQCLVCFDHGDSTTSGELVAAHIGCIRDLEARIEQLEIRQKMRDDGEHSLMAEIEARDARIAELEEALRAYHALFTAWEGESLSLDQEALRQWKSIASGVLEGRE